ncbi:MAG TPA: hypothetical protein VFS29_12925 [Motilibacteraceae bacterium]|nr:hypothetical protein [Motilibacteraceae bacterium]
MPDVLPVALLHSAAAACTGVALLLGIVTLLRTRSVHAAFGVFLDFLLAAGLLRLAGPTGWDAVVVAAGVVVVRKLATTDLRRLSRPHLPRWARRLRLDGVGRGVSEALHPVALRWR